MMTNLLRVVSISNDVLGLNQGVGIRGSHNWYCYKGYFRKVVKLYKEGRCTRRDGMFRFRHIGDAK